MNTIPFLFTILLSVFSWTTNQIIVGLEKQPLLEIKSKIFHDGKIVYVLTNISSEKLYKDLIFEIYGGIESCSGEQDVFLGPPNMKSRDTPPPLCNGNTAVEFTVDEFHPSSSIKLIANVTMNGGLNSNALYVKSDVPIKIVDRGLQTMLVKEKLTLLSLLFIVWIVLLFLYVVSVRRDWINADA